MQSGHGGVNARDGSEEIFDNEHKRLFILTGDIGRDDAKIVRAERCPASNCQRASVFIDGYTDWDGHVRIIREGRQGVGDR